MNRRELLSMLEEARYDAVVTAVLADALEEEGYPVRDVLLALRAGYLPSPSQLQRWIRTGVVGVLDQVGWSVVRPGTVVVHDGRVREILDTYDDDGLYRVEWTDGTASLVDTHDRFIVARWR